ncbi:MAG: class I SAM-dependent methyltransferase [Rhizobiaceae bacterium]
MKTNLKLVSSLLEEIRTQIENEGPLSIADFMALCLTHPKYGYYTTSNPIGKAGDFITAPEISQMFGELIGIWCLEVWRKLGSPAVFNLVEFGPGHGTLMADLLRAANTVPEFIKAANVHLIEISPKLIKKQKQTLNEHQQSIKWIDSISALPCAPTIIVANEFLDALPFRQWVKHEGQWYERAVGFKNGKLTYTLRPSKPDEQELPPEHLLKPDGSIFETSPAREALISDTAHILKAQTGAALFIDYGHLKSGFGDTFQAVSDHSFSAPLENIGKSDLTNHVDFAPLVKLANRAGCAVPPSITQSQFLLSLGLLERAGALGAEKDYQAQEKLRLAVERLAAPEHMGELFKVMAFGTITKDWPAFQ